MNKAENKYWKNTSNLIKNDKKKELVRNKSAREKLRITSIDCTKLMKKMEEMEVDE